MRTVVIVVVVLWLLDRRGLWPAPEQRGRGLTLRGDPIERRSARPHTLLATLSRSGCAGWCLEYQVRVYRDGIVEFHGDAGVKVIGEVRGEISDTQLDELEALFADHDYFSLADEYVDDGIFEPTYSTTSFHTADRSKQVRQRSGGGRKNEILADLERGFERIVDIDHWKGSTADLQALCGR